MERRLRRRKLSLRQTRRARRRDAGSVASHSPRMPAAKEKAPVTFNKNDFKNDPLIQKALEIFKGQIVEVRA